MEVVNVKFRTQVLLSAQRALIGEIYPEIRAISVAYKDRALRLKYYVNRPVSEVDFERAAIITSEMVADMTNEFELVEELCIHSKNRLAELDGQDGWVFAAHEM